MSTFIRWVLTGSSRASDASLGAGTAAQTGIAAGAAGTATSSDGN